MAEASGGIEIEPTQRTNHLLVIGIDAYAHHRQLNNARRDAEAFRDILLQHYLFEKNHVTELFDEEATRRNILRTLEQLDEQLTPRDNLIIYFSGHGIMNRRQTQGFWIPVEAEGGGTVDYIPNTRVRDLIRDMEAHHIYLIADACFAGSMILRRAEDSRHLDLLEANPSRRVLSSGRQEEVADGPPGGHSPFFECLRHQLLSFPGPSLTAKELELYAEQNTPRSALQQPVAEFLFGTGDLSGQFVFFKRLNLEAAYQDAKATGTRQALETFLINFPQSPYTEEIKSLLLQQADLTAWQKAQEANNVRAYREYRRKFTQGDFRTEALEQMEALEAEKAWQRATRLDTVSAYDRFLDRYPDSPFATKAEKRIEELLGEDPPTAPQKPQPTAKPKQFSFPVPEMVRIPGGTFQMGSNKYDDEKPIHQVTLDRFELGKYLVTQREWQAIMGENPSHFKGEDRPVESVSWDDCQAFIQKLNEKTGLNFRLPTEAEWEYAARGDQDFLYAGSNDLDEVGWYWENSGDKRLSGDWDLDKINQNNCQTHPVGQKKSNTLSLYDMSGNVWEWCQDWYGDYPSEPQTNPTGPGDGADRVYRGGSWVSDAGNCRVANRNGYHPGYRFDNLGFRLARPL